MCSATQFGAKLDFASKIRYMFFFILQLLKVYLRADMQLYKVRCMLHGCKNIEDPYHPPINMDPAISWGLKAMSFR